MITDNVETRFSSMYVQTGENKGMIKSKQFRSYAEKIFSRILVLGKFNFAS